MILTVSATEEDIAPFSIRAAVTYEVQQEADVTPPVEAADAADGQQIIITYSQEHDGTDLIRPSAGESVSFFRVSDTQYVFLDLLLVDARGNEIDDAQFTVSLHSALEGVTDEALSEYVTLENGWYPTDPNPSHYALTIQKDACFSIYVVDSNGIEANMQVTAGQAPELVTVVLPDGSVARDLYVVQGGSSPELRALVYPETAAVQDVSWKILSVLTVDGTFVRTDTMEPNRDAEAFIARYATVSDGVITIDPDTPGETYFNLAAYVEGFEYNGAIAYVTVIVTPGIDESLILIDDMPATTYEMDVALADLYDPENGIFMGFSLMAGYVDSAGELGYFYNNAVCQWEYADENSRNLLYMHEVPGRPYCEVMVAPTGYGTAKIKATITYTGKDGQEKTDVHTVSITIGRAPDEIKLDTDYVQIPAGKSVTLKATAVADLTLNPTPIRDSSIFWSMDAGQLVYEDGRTSGIPMSLLRRYVSVSGGTVKVNADIFDDVLASLGIDPRQPIRGISFVVYAYSGFVGTACEVLVVPSGEVHEKVKLYAGQTPLSGTMEFAISVSNACVLQAEVLNKDGQLCREQTVTWSVSDPEMAYVDDSGMVRFAGPGKVVVTATSLQGKSASVTITVTQEPYGMTIVDAATGAEVSTNPYIPQGGSRKLAAQLHPQGATPNTVSWEICYVIYSDDSEGFDSDDEAVIKQYASVSGGTVKATKAAPAGMTIGVRAYVNDAKAGFGLDGDKVVLATTELIVKPTPGSSAIFVDGTVKSSYTWNVDQYLLYQGDLTGTYSSLPLKAGVSDLSQRWAEIEDLRVAWDYGDTASKNLITIVASENDSIYANILPMNYGTAKVKASITYTDGTGKEKTDVKTLTLTINRRPDYLTIAPEILEIFEGTSATITAKPVYENPVNSASTKGSALWSLEAMELGWDGGSFYLDAAEIASLNQSLVKVSGGKVTVAANAARKIAEMVPGFPADQYESARLSFGVSVDFAGQYRNVWCIVKSMDAAAVHNKVELYHEETKLGSSAAFRIYESDFLQLTAKVLNKSGTELEDQDLTWTSSDWNIAQVNSAYGDVSFLAPGKVTITATTSQGKSASVTYTVTQAPEQVTVIDTVTGEEVLDQIYQMPQNSSRKFTASVLPLGATPSKITWMVTSVSNDQYGFYYNAESHASLIKQMVTVSSGTVTVTKTAPAGTVIYVAAYVDDSKAGFGLKEDQIPVYREFALEVTPVAAKSSIFVENAALSSFGYGVEAYNLSAEGGLCLNTLTLQAAVSDLAGYRMPADGSYSVLWSYGDEKSKDIVSFLSDDLSQPSVEITAKNFGTAKINATFTHTSNTGKVTTEVKSLTLEVYRVVDDVHLSQKEATIIEGKSLTLKANAFYSVSDSAVKPKSTAITWSVQGVVLLDENGEGYCFDTGYEKYITIKNGTCTVTRGAKAALAKLRDLDPDAYQLRFDIVASSNGPKTHCAVQVLDNTEETHGKLSLIDTNTGKTAAGGKIHMEDQFFGLYLDAQVLNTSGEPAADQTVHWYSDNIAVAAVEEGSVIFFGPGKVTITASSSQGKSVSLTYTVTQGPQGILLKNAQTNQELEWDDIPVPQNGTFKMTAVVYPQGATPNKVTWEIPEIFHESFGVISNAATIKKYVTISSGTVKVAKTAPAGMLIQVRAYINDAANGYGTHDKQLYIGNAAFLKVTPVKGAGNIFIDGWATTKEDWGLFASELGDGIATMNLTAGFSDLSGSPMEDDGSVTYKWDFADTKSKDLVSIEVDESNPAAAQLRPLNFGTAKIKVTMTYADAAGKTKSEVKTLTLNLYRLIDNLVMSQNGAQVVEGKSITLKATAFTDLSVNATKPKSTAIGWDIAEVTLVDESGRVYYVDEMSLYSNLVKLKSGTLTVSRNAKQTIATAMGFDSEQAQQLRLCVEIVAYGDGAADGCYVTVLPASAEVHNKVQLIDSHTGKVMSSTAKFHIDTSYACDLNAKVLNTAGKEAADQIAYWSTSDQNVATVGEGYIIFRNPGKVTITAVSQQGKSASVTFTVTKAPTGVILQNAVAEEGVYNAGKVNQNGSVKLTAATVPANATPNKLGWIILYIAHEDLGYVTDAATIKKYVTVSSGTVKATKIAPHGMVIGGQVYVNDAKNGYGMELEQRTIGAAFVMQVEGVKSKANVYLDGVAIDKDTWSVAAGAGSGEIREYTAAFTDLAGDRLPGEDGITYKWDYADTKSKTLVSFCDTQDGETVSLGFLGYGTAKIKLTMTYTDAAGKVKSLTKTITVNIVKA